MTEAAGSFEFLSTFKHDIYWQSLVVKLVCLKNFGCSFDRANRLKPWEQAQSDALKKSASCTHAELLLALNSLSQEAEANRRPSRIPLVFNSRSVSWA